MNKTIFVTLFHVVQNNRWDRYFNDNNLLRPFISDPSKYFKQSHQVIMYRFPVIWCVRIKCVFNALTNIAWWMIRWKGRKCSKANFLPQTTPYISFWNRSKIPRDMKKLATHKGVTLLNMDIPFGILLLCDDN